MGWFSDAFSFLCKGGMVMIPLMACSMISVTVLIERFMRLKQARANTDGLINQVENLLLGGQTKKASELCDSFGGAVASVISAGLRSAHLGTRGAERAMEEAATRETSKLQNRLSILDTIITIAPLLGLLGTVTGMIRSFHVISSKEGISTPMAITGGVAEALIATATGLAVAIITLIGYNYLNEQIRKVTEEMEMRGNQVLNAIEDMGEVKRETSKLSA